MYDILGDRRWIILSFWSHEWSSDSNSFSLFLDFSWIHFDDFCDEDMEVAYATCCYSKRKSFSDKRYVFNLLFPLSPENVVIKPDGFFLLFCSMFLHPQPVPLLPLFPFQAWPNFVIVLFLLCIYLLRYSFQVICLHRSFAHSLASFPNQASKNSTNRYNVHTYQGTSSVTSL